MPLPDDQPHTRTRLPVGEQPSLQPSGRQARPLRSLLAVLVVVTLLVLAISIANRGKTVPPAGSGSAGSSGAAAPPPGSTAPTAPSGEQPVTGSYPHTEQGAQSAAANYAVALGGADMFRADGRRTILTAIADPGAIGALQARLDQAITPDVLTGYGLDAQGKAPKGLTFVSRAVPVGTKTDGYTADSTKAMVWCVGLGGLAGVSSTKPVAENWYTLTLTLRWTGTDWKLADFSRQPGPAPVPADQQAANAEEITGAVQQFGGFRYAR